MNFGLKSLTKMAGSMLGPEAVIEMMAGAGIKLSHQDVSPEQAPAAFQSAVKVSLRPGARVIALHGEDREGSKIEALIVLAPAAAPVTLETKNFQKKELTLTADAL